MGEITVAPEVAIPVLREPKADVRFRVSRPLPKSVQDIRRTGAPSGAILAFHPLSHTCELHFLELFPGEGLRVRPLRNQKLQLLTTVAPLTTVPDESSSSPVGLQAERLAVPGVAELLSSLVPKQMRLNYPSISIRAKMAISQLRHHAPVQTSPVLRAVVLTWRDTRLLVFDDHLSCRHPIRTLGVGLRIRLPGAVTIRRLELCQVRFRLRGLKLRY